MRGREVSRRPGDVIVEVARLAQDGVRELTLLGQNVNSWGRDLAPEIHTEFGELLRAQVRDFDVAARLGGEEFAILLPQTTAEAAAVVAARTRDTLEASPMAVSEVETVRLTASFGIAESSPAQTTDELLRRADDALYAAKRAGKNRYVVDATTGVS